METSFATLKLDSPPLISIYYLPYKNREVKKIVFYSGHYNSSNWTLRQELFGLTILSVFYLVHNGFNLSYMAQLEMVLTK